MPALKSKDLHGVQAHAARVRQRSGGAIKDWISEAVIWFRIQVILAFLSHKTVNSSAGSNYFLKRQSILFVFRHSYYFISNAGALVSWLLSKVQAILFCPLKTASRFLKAHANIP